MVHEITRDTDRRETWHRTAVRCDGCGRETRFAFCDGSDWELRYQKLVLSEEHGFQERIEGRFLRDYCAPCLRPAGEPGQLALFAEARV